MGPIRCPFAHLRVPVTVLMGINFLSREIQRGGVEKFKGEEYIFLHYFVLRLKTQSG
jgi:hypothetical protein